MDKLIILDKYKNLNIINKANIKDTEIKLNKNNGSINIRIKYNNKEEFINSQDIICPSIIKEIIKNTQVKTNGLHFIEKFITENIKNNENVFLMNCIELLNFIEDLYKWDFQICNIIHNYKYIEPEDFNIKYTEHGYNIAIHTHNYILHNNIISWHICFNKDYSYIYNTIKVDNFDYQRKIKYKVYEYSKEKPAILEALQEWFTVYYKNDANVVNNLIK